jgi:phospholipase A1
MKTTRNSTGPWFTRFVFAVCLVSIGPAGLAAEHAEATACAAIPSDRERLECYDALAGRRKAKPAAEPLQPLGVAAPPTPALGAAPPTALSVRWELDPETKQGPWVIRPYEPVFLLPWRRTDRPNDSPQSPSHPLSASAPFENKEAEFQLSLKVKAVENLFSGHADLWLGYTQQSQWQIYNGDISEPFRETDYMPEVFLLFPTRYHLLGLTGRFVRLGLLHESNGRGDPLTRTSTIVAYTLSRSWNRVYAQFGFERGNLTLLVRPWYRLHEDPVDDDNSDIIRYMGHGDVTAIYQWDQQEFSLLARRNGGYGAVQGTWSFPIQKRLKGYVKLFSGYGETLIDYNWSQTTVGVGILLVDWQ